MSDKRKRLRPAAAAAAIAAAVSLSSCAIRPPTDCKVIPNFHEVLPGTHIYSGGQPNNVAAWQHLQKLGVKRIVKLNTTRTREEPETAKEFGMEVIAVPITGTGMWLAGPSRNSLNKAVAAIGPGTYIHCQHGQDRTGLIVGAWQVQAGGRSKGKAWDQMITRGFRPMPGLFLSWIFAVHPPSKP